MRITAFWAKGYRSLADVHIDGLGPFNVFYGPNGAGKSNILAAMRTLFGLLAWRSPPGASFDERPVLYQDDHPVVQPRDRCRFQPEGPLVLGARLMRTTPEPGAMDIWPRGHELVLEVTYDWFARKLAITSLQFRPVPAFPVLDTLNRTDLEVHRALHELVYRVATRAYALIDAHRMPQPETVQRNSRGVDVPAMLAEGRLKEGMFRASSHIDRHVRQRFKQFQDLLAGPPLHRPPFEFVYTPDGIVDLVEQAPTNAQNPTDVPLDLAGLGIAQIYSILGQALLRNADAVAIEEPEAHLHARTNGLHLRHLLERLVNDGYLEQLFIATHSNLFDLDPTGYYDVSQDERGATRVERKPLSEIDREHLYEPGPAKHALAEFLRYMEPDAVVFRRPDGSPVSVSEMLDMLQRDDEVAVEFLRDVHGAAVRAVRVKHKKPAAANES